MTDKKFYALKAGKSYDFVVDENLEEIFKHCRNSEFQFLSREPIKIISEDKQFEFCEFYMIANVMPVFSDYFFCRLNPDDYADSLFIKPVIISSFGESHNYVMGLPRRINCIDPYRLESVRTDGKSNDKLIISKYTGRFNIFKVYGISDDNIYVSQRLKNLIDNIAPYNVEWE